MSEVSFLHSPKKISLALLEESKDLPKKVKDKILELRNKWHDVGFEKMEVRKKNGLTNATSRENVVSVLEQYPRMQLPLLTAHKHMSDTGKWLDYFEKTIGTIFQMMIRSGKPKLVKMAQEGVIDKKTLIKYFRERFSERGLKISEIKKGEDILPFAEFRKRVERGPILDNAFSGSRLTTHGPYPHLFQLDYLIDEMAVSGNIKDYSEFFKFFATNDGLKVWNDSFDLFGTTRNLKSTNVITEKFLKEFM